MSLAIFHPHFVIRILSSTFYHPHFSIRILSSSFFYPPSAIRRHPVRTLQRPDGKLKFSFKPGLRGFVHRTSHALRVLREQIVFIRISSIVNIESSSLGESHERNAFRYPRFFGRRVRRKSWNKNIQGKTKRDIKLLNDFLRGEKRKSESCQQLL